MQDLHVGHFQLALFYCTALVVRSDDVAPSYSVGVLTSARLAEEKEVGRLVKSPVIKLACSDLQHTRRSPS